ncbi:MAG: DNA-binding response regulator [Clostridia bacterium]|jgi:DNA-binding response OmpR family regulator|nr:DNA-binding response regulator [Clostridia bacterium]
MYKIYIVEDDDKIKNELGIFLSKNGYEIEKIGTFNNVLENIINSNSDLVLLDINLPRYDGYYICKELRKVSDIPIIIVTSRNSEIDELMSMNIGADDFITKPYSVQILLARIEAIFKRVNKINNNSIINFNGIKFDLSKSIIEFEKETIELSKNETKILHYLLKNKGVIVSREEIMVYLWDSEMFVDDNTLTVNINRLRKKLSDIGKKDIIETKRGQGYIII